MSHPSPVWKPQFWSASPKLINVEGSWKPASAVATSTLVASEGSCLPVSGTISSRYANTDGGRLVLGYRVSSLQDQLLGEHMGAFDPSRIEGVGYKAIL